MNIMDRNKPNSIIFPYLACIIILFTTIQSAYSANCRDRKSTLPLHRYFNGKTGDHFYTTNWSELGGSTGDYKYEGVQCRIFSRRESGSDPLFRYYNSGSGDHFYTTYWPELGGGGKGYVYEGIAGYIYPGRAVPPTGTVALLRYFNGNSGDHFYTTNRNELEGGKDGYVSEGNAGYVCPK